MSAKKKAMLEGSSNGIKIRADRLSPAQERLELAAKINSRHLQIVNLSESGVALKGDIESRPGDQVDVVITLSKDKPLYDGKGQIRWVETTEENTTLGVSFTTDVLERDIVDALDTFSALGNELLKKKEAHLSLPSEYREFISDYKNFLRELKASLDEMEEKLRAESLESKKSYSFAFETLFMPKFVAEIHSFNRRLDSIAQKFQEKKTRKIAIDMFQKEIAPFLTAAPFIHRALLKPLGHAGDYEMMNQIYRNRSEGKTFFEKIIHRAGVNESSSLSVRYRRTFLKEKIKSLLKKNSEIRVASIACGPAKEVVDLIAELDEQEINRITFVLVDQEPEALLNAKREILSECLRKEKSVRIDFVPHDIRGIIEGTLPDSLADGNFDLIYSAGLFDYLLEGPAKLLAMNLLDLIKTNGQLLIGNFHPDNPTKTISEFTANWRLFHRTEEDMLRLVPDNAVKDKKLIFDDGKIEIFIEATK